jgi:hypothetical protein
VLLNGGRDAIKRRAELGQKGHAARRQYDTAAQSTEQRGQAQPLLQQANLLTDRAVGDAKFDSRILETAATGGRFEGANGIQRR